MNYTSKMPRYGFATQWFNVTMLVMLFAAAGFMMTLAGARLWLSSARNKTGLTPVVLRKNIVGP